MTTLRSVVPARALTGIELLYLSPTSGCDRTSVGSTMFAHTGH